MYPRQTALINLLCVSLSLQKKVDLGGFSLRHHQSHYPSFLPEEGITIQLH